MSKRSNPMFKKTTPAPEPAAPVQTAIDGAGPLNETFPGGLSIAQPLSTRERKRLQELEGVVIRNIKAFYEVGCALREIRESQLYRETHMRFDEYVKDLWDMARCRAYQLIDAANVVDLLKDAAPRLDPNLHNCGDGQNIYNCRHEDGAILPQNEGQARALAKYAPEKQIEIWRETVNSAAGGKITASHVRATADALGRKNVKRKTNTTRREVTRAPRISEDFRKAFQAFLDQINVERESGWKHTDSKEVAKHLRGLVQAVEAPL